MTRAYRTLVEDATRLMRRLQAVFPARAIATRGTKVSQRRERARWLAQLTDRGARFRAQVLDAELDRLRALRPKATAAMLAEARREPAGAVLRTLPSLGPVRVALLLAPLGTPWRFRTGPLQEFYHRLIAQGMRPELARVTLPRKLAALTLRLWQRGDPYDPTQLTAPAR